MTFWEFAAFDRFVSPTVLIIFYYLGALGVPILLAWLLIQLRRSSARLDLPDNVIYRWIVETWRQRAWLVRLWALIVFLGCELFWRMLFEFLLAYFQMHEYLARLAGQG